METAEQKLFSPTEVGDFELKNRISMGAMLRQRAHLDGSATDVMADYYSQRAGAGLLTTESTNISPDAFAYFFGPNMYSREHMESFKKVIDAVHGAGGVIFCQLHHAGRVCDPLMLPGGRQAIGPSAVRVDYDLSKLAQKPLRVKREFQVPREMTKDDITRTIDEYKTATELAFEAGFDGVELHGASGYLPHQFLGSNSNLRSDEYGGSVEKRARFYIEVLEAMSSVKGAGRVGVKISPHLGFYGVEVADADIIYPYICKAVSGKIAYMQLRRQDGMPDPTKLIRPFFSGTVSLIGGLTRDSAIEAIDNGQVDMVGFGHNFISNPDLVERLRNEWSLTPVNYDNLQDQGSAGYTDYPFYQ